ncbi:MAG TPA: glycoside hydrolase family 76 protein [Candidatus Sulfopaludibacter sp.]|jgi:predicted alpha-1,6-mannanase (GH76 family)|nr:glycoside hydrolase family 76 protein [Candidatus Sulfopaludibacter sp.]
MIRTLIATMMLAGGLSAADVPCAPEMAACSKAGIETLQGWYAQDTGLWKTTNWWNAANGVTVAVRYSRLTGSTELKAAIENTFTRNSGKNFLNEYYDDEGWWALAWIDAYEWSHDTRYLDMAETIFTDMRNGWDDTCNGGIWWRKDKRYKNAIANELFLSVAARLATVGPKDRRKDFLDWAKKEWQWFSATGMINDQNLVNDGLTAACQNNHRNTWSYNQGVILGGLSALSALTGDAELLQKAQTIALSAIGKLSTEAGILHESCEPNCGADGVQFKGIFMRNLATLNAAAPSDRIQKFLVANGKKICELQTPEHKFSVTWSQPSDVISAASQISALDAVLAAQSQTCSAKQ